MGDLTATAVARALVYGLDVHRLNFLLGSASDGADYTGCNDESVKDRRCPPQLCNWAHG